MDDRSENIFPQNNMEEILLIRPEPCDQMEVEAILPDPLELSVEVKPEVVCKEESNTKTSNHLNYREVHNLPNLTLDNTYLNVNGVFYVIQKIPEALAQSLLIQNVAPQTIKITNDDLETKTFPRDDPAPCPKCGKILKRRSSLKVHMQVCSVPFVMNNPPFSGQPFYRCENCDYKTKSEHCWSLHADKCSGKTQKSDETQPNSKNKAYRFMGICLGCNDANSPLSTKTCNKCGSAKRWQCNNCNAELETFAKAKYHSRAKCRPDDSYYCCIKCDFKSRLKYHVRRHIEKSHADSISSDASNYIENRIVPTAGSGAENACSLCGKNFEDVPGLNRHTVVCKKYELLPQNASGNIKTEDLSTDSFTDLSETDLNLQCEYEEINAVDLLQTDSRSELAPEFIKTESLELLSETIETESRVDLPKKNSNVESIYNRHRKFISRHCKKCNRNIELERSGVKNSKPCKICFQIMVYKCKKCGDIQKVYAESVKHVKAVCDQEDRDVFKCVQCNFSSHSKYNLTEHNRRVHGDISATCINCAALFTNSTRFKNHIKFCGLPAIFQCDKCAFLTTTKGYLRKHIESSHGMAKAHVPNFSRINNSADRFSKASPHIQSVCTTCHKRQKTSYRLKRCITCNVPLQFRCVTCDKMHGLDDAEACKHVKALVELLALECQICSKGFLNRVKFELHKKTCVEPRRSYNCTLCKYFTPIFERLQMHCRKKHKSRIILNANESIQSVVKIEKISHPCHYCSYKTSSNISLEKHMKIHMKKKLNPLLCPKSEKEISDNSGITNYECEEKDKLNLECKVILKRLDMNTI